MHPALPQFAETRFLRGGERRRKSGYTLRLAVIWQKLWHLHLTRALNLNSEIPLVFNTKYFSVGKSQKKDESTCYVIRSRERFFLCGASKRRLLAKSTLRHKYKSQHTYNTMNKLKVYYCNKATTVGISANDCSFVKSNIRYEWFTALLTAAAESNVRTFSLLEHRIVCSKTWMCMFAPLLCLSCPCYGSIPSLMRPAKC
jgi:hypothetical protein